MLSEGAPAACVLEELFENATTGRMVCEIGAAGPVVESTDLSPAILAIRVRGRSRHSCGWVHWHLPWTTKDKAGSMVQFRQRKLYWQSPLFAVETTFLSFTEE